MYEFALSRVAAHNHPATERRPGSPPERSTRRGAKQRARNETRGAEEHRARTGARRKPSQGVRRGGPRDRRRGAAATEETPKTHHKKKKKRESEKGKEQGYGFLVSVIVFPFLTSRTDKLSRSRSIEHARVTAAYGDTDSHFDQLFLE
ncbi:hypothetical protein SKAU_G00272650 [Synaphobranchus kaupii]|uniref:Uncharacterized protein n=1 Tax=Synaphobranchus kaupii TaxID=118154 RepID=A0A9Q1IQR2_SYNKA|nr:hypothetical protein SKAU_G00272650 [Synaphobranchus kaupii]